MASEADLLTLREVISRSDMFLTRKGVPDARVVCELLAARLLRCGRMELYRYLDQPLSERMLDAMRRGVKRVSEFEPVQYVLGQWDFRDLTLKTDKRALIPRPETEGLVQLVLDSPRVKALKRPLVLDIGTGSGCIILSLAKEMADGIFVGVDISADALALAQENARLTGLEDKVKFAQCDGCDGFDEQMVDIIVSNPPYIPSAQIETLDPWIRDHEPRNALDGGPDGLTVYESFLMEAIMVLKPGGLLFFEIGDDQGPAMREKLEEYGFLEVEIRKDNAGLDRYALAVWASD